MVSLEEAEPPRREDYGSEYLPPKHPAIATACGPQNGEIQVAGTRAEMPPNSGELAFGNQPAYSSKKTPATQDSGVEQSSPRKIRTRQVIIKKKSAE